MKRIAVFLFATIVLSLVFFAFNTSFSAGIPLLSLPVWLIFSAAFVYFALYRFLKQNEVNFLSTVRKFLEYLPFVMLIVFFLYRADGKETSFGRDLFTVVLWVITFVISLVTLFFLKEKRLPFKLPEQKKRTGIKCLIFETLDWIDAALQAVFIITLVNIFIIQLYKIPSESMVPQFLTNDRVVVFKTLAGPTFPLTDISLPRLRSYKRGDIVVFRNPHTEQTKKSEVKNFTNQLVFMLTLTTVNLNVDEKGEVIADPLVKRVTGVPGEQLVMVDGVLYSRTKDRATFEPVKEDASWAEWNLNDLPEKLKKNVREFPISEEFYASMLKTEKLRKELDIEQVQKQTESITQSFLQIRSKLSQTDSNTTDYKNTILPKDMFAYQMFSKHEDIARKLLTVDGGGKWFSEFMTSWTAAYSKSLLAEDPYEDSMFRLNLLLKLTFGKLVLYDSEVMYYGKPVSVSYSEQAELMQLAQDLYLYTMLNDSRNMCVFPSNENGTPRYIPENCFFMMGDNRFNSLDMRHSYDLKPVKITNQDEYSLRYNSRLEPQYVGSKRMLGGTSFRFWPLNRISLIKRNKQAAN